MPGSTARLSEYERDLLLIAIAQLLVGVFRRVPPCGIPAPGAHSAGQAAERLIVEVMERESR